MKKDPGIEALEAIWSDPKGVRVPMLSLLAKQRLLIEERRELLAKGG